MMSEASFDPSEIVAPEAVGLCSRRLERADAGLSGSPKGVGSYAWGGYWHTGSWAGRGAVRHHHGADHPAEHVQNGEKVPHLVYQALLD